MILPRQARDKHREDSKKARFVAGWLGLILGTRLWYAMHPVLSFQCCLFPVRSFSSVFPVLSFSLVEMSVSTSYIQVCHVGRREGRRCCV